MSDASCTVIALSPCSKSDYQFVAIASREYYRTDSRKRLIPAAATVIGLAGGPLVDGALAELSSLPTVMPYVAALTCVILTLFAVMRAPETVRKHGAFGYTLGYLHAQLRLPSTGDRLHADLPIAATLNADPFRFSDTLRIEEGWGLSDEVFRF